MTKRDAMRYARLVLLCGVSMGALYGCGAVRPYPVEVSLDPRIRDRSVQVDLVAVNEADFQAWQTYSMTEYWQYGDAWRRDAEKFVMKFGQDQPATQTLAVDDPIWKIWMSRGSTRLLILGDLPEVVQDRPGSGDPRRVVVPLNSAAWQKPKPGDKRPIEIRVEAGMIKCLTPFDPAKY